MNNLSSFSLSIEWTIQMTVDLSDSGHWPSNLCYHQKGNDEFWLIEEFEILYLLLLLMRDRESICLVDVNCCLPMYTKFKYLDTSVTSSSKSYLSASSSSALAAAVCSSRTKEERHHRMGGLLIGGGLWGGGGVERGCVDLFSVCAPILHTFPIKIIFFCTWLLYKEWGTTFTFLKKIMK
jgi:hypothetical protein